MTESNPVVHVEKDDEHALTILRYIAAARSASRKPDIDMAEPRPAEFLDEK